MNLLDNLKILFLYGFIVAPFVFAFLIGAFSTVKNPIYSRRLSIFFCFLQFIFSSIIYIGFGKLSFSFFHLSFNLDKFSSILLLLVSFIFFIISIISKTFILKSHKSFWSVSFLMYGLINAILLSDNILVCFLNLIWLSFLSYFLNLTFSYSKNYIKDINSVIKTDICVIVVSSALILFDFLRYFILNDIEFCFSKISENLYHINPVSTLIAFLGFLILTFKMFNLVPLCAKNIANSNKINPLVVYMNTIIQFVSGSFLFLKTNTIFSYLYWDYQEIILCFIVFNILYYLVLSLRNDSICKFLNSVFTTYFLINLLSIFVFSEKGISVFIYSAVTTIIAFGLFYFTIILLSNKFHTDKFEEFKKIPSKNHLTIFFVIFSILNFAGVPLLSVFSSRFAIFTTLYGIEFDDLLLSSVPYISIISCMALSIIIFKTFHSVLIAPVDIQKCSFELSRHQLTVLVFIGIFALITGLFGYNIINEFIVTLSV